MKTKKLCLVLTVAVSFWALGCVGLFASEMDDKIESTAKQSYIFKTYLKDDNISIKSKDGVVTLSGTVSEEMHKALAQETVAGLPGVKTIENNLEGIGKAAETGINGMLRNKVTSTLYLHQNVNSELIDVTADQGSITLSGTASSSAQKDLATEYVKDVEGVTSVKNDMTVKEMVIQPNENMKSMHTSMTKIRKKDASTHGKMDTLLNTMDNAVEWADDASITGLVKTTLLYHRSTSSLNTSVETKNGVVTLGGFARNEAEKELAGKLVGDVYGVKSVINNMTVTVESVSKAN